MARSRYRGTVKRRMARRVEAAPRKALANVDVYDAAQQTELDRVIDAARHPARSRLVRDRAGRAAGDLRLGATDGPRIAVAPLPIPFSPSKRAPDERLPARLLSARAC